MRRDRLHLPRVTLALALVAACAHSASSPSEAPPTPEQAETAERIRQEMAGDPFAAVDAGPPHSATSALPAQPAADAGDPPPAGLNPPPIDGDPPEASAPVAAPAPLAAPGLPARDPRREADQALNQAVVAARTQSPADCARSLNEARHTHTQATPAARQALLQQEVKCEEKAKDLVAARDSALFLLSSCGPDAADRCRTRAKALLRRLASAKPRDPVLLKSLTSVDQADSCVAHLDRAKLPNATCVPLAEITYKHIDDKLMLARLRLAEAHAALRGKKDPDIEHRLTRAVSTCIDPRCAGVRNQGYEAEARWFEGQKKYEEAARARINQDRVTAEAMAPDQRRYYRSPALDRACGLLDAQKGPGSCRALELRLTGSWSFHDHSTEHATSGLDPTRIRGIGDEYAITLQDCFRDQALRLPVPSQATYQLSWMIGADGRVAQLHVDPTAEEILPLGACLRERFGLWRYPRFNGENAHVEQSYTISAKEH